VNCELLVDLGCGRGIIGALCRIYRAPRRLVGIDAFEPYLAFCRQMRFYDEAIAVDLRAGREGNPFQRHLSLWTTREFRGRGYLVQGVGAMNVGYEVRRAMGKVIGKRGVSIAQSKIRGAAPRVSEALGHLTRSWPQLQQNFCV
jgi:hypothetical protein